MSAEVEALSDQGWLLLRTGRDRETAVCRAVCVLASGDGTDSPRLLWRSLFTLLSAGDLLRADEHCHRLATNPVAPRSSLSGQVTSLVQARVRYLQGRPTEALARFEALEAPRGVDPLAGVRAAWTIETLLDLGEPCAADALLRSMRLDGPVSPRVPGRSLLLVARGRVRLALDSPSAAVVDLLDGGRELVNRGVVNPAVARWRSHAALAFIHDRADTSRVLATEELSLAQGWGALPDLGWALHVDALVSADEQTPGRLAEAIELLEVAGARTELTEVLYGAAKVFVSTGDLPAGRQRLHRAAEIAAEDGRVQWKSRVDVALDQLSRRRPPCRLTKQQWRVATLARSGSTNQDIAHQLQLSVRAVEFHLSATYRRLGISGRQELYQTIG
ncbi:helix-turn-helix transcriptional regulator [Kribbella sp. NPDC056861]|uniref:helix-turn-helix transcriptional regulator n=1 Tax=Kribbella sp. NPDC056861 TaxID=3154857 RepID=UPI0034426FCD